jgi:hypothetical protein
MGKAMSVSLLMGKSIAQSKRIAPERVNLLGAILFAVTQLITDD